MERARADSGIIRCWMRSGTPCRLRPADIEDYQATEDPLFIAVKMRLGEQPSLIRGTLASMDAAYTEAAVTPIGRGA